MTDICDTCGLSADVHDDGACPEKGPEMPTYTVQQHQPSGETYLLRAEGETITGVCGPLSHGEWSGDGGATVKPGFDPSDCDFSAEDAAWANAQEWGAPKQ